MRERFFLAPLKGNKRELLNMLNGRSSRILMMKKGEEPRAAAIRIIEASHYFWWWYALTLNDSYKERSFSILRKDTDPVVKDFGVVDYEGDRYQAFVEWWHGRFILPNNDPLLTRYEKAHLSRGQYLFAEPLYDGKVQVLVNTEQADIALNSNAHMVISIPLTASKSHINDYMKEALNGAHPAYSEGMEQDAKNSNALYPPTKEPRINSLITLFHLYDLNQKGGMTHFQMADELGIISKPKPDPVTGEIDVPDQMARTIEKVSRRLKEADDIIANVGNGVFP